MRTLLESDELARLRQALTSADYHLDAITDRLGSAAVAATGRGDHRAMLAATGDGGPQSTLIRLFMCGTSEPAAQVAAALAPLPVETAVDAGLLRAEGDEYRAGLGLECYGRRWVLSDLPAALGGTVTTDHVLGVGGAANSLSGYMIRRPVASALDVGTGGGIQALSLSDHAEQVTVTDILPRALRFAASNAALNGLVWETLAGDMLDPVAGRRFDQVVCNPPFIVGPARTDFTYRDSGRAGDGVCAELAAAAPRLLNPGGTLQFLANWVHVRGQDWTDRVAGWFDGTGCDVWAIQRDTCDPLDYVRLWQRDAAQAHDPQLLAQWLDWFDANDIEAVGFGVINARLRESGPVTVVCEDARQQPAAPFADLITAWFDTADWLAHSTPEQLLATRLRLADGVVLEQDAVLGAEGWEVCRQLVSDTAGMRRREEIDPLLVSFLGGCTGVVDVRTLVGLLAEAHEAPHGLLAASLAPVITRFIQRGFLVRQS